MRLEEPTQEGTVDFWGSGLSCRLHGVGVGVAAHHCTALTLWDQVLMDAVAAASRNAEKHAAENEELRQRVQALESEVRAGGGGGGATVPVCRGFCVDLLAGMLSRRAPCFVDPEMVAPVPHHPLSMVW